MPAGLAGPPKLNPVLGAAVEPKADIVAAPNILVVATGADPNIPVLAAG